MTEPVAWTEVRVLVPEGWGELVASALAVPPCTSVAFGRTSIGMEPPPEGYDYLRTFFPAHEDRPEVRSALRAALDQLALTSAVPELAGLSMTFKELPPEDYATSWKKSWKPFRVHDLCVVPSWWKGKLRSSDRRLTLEPGGAFGSGRHATTRTCLKVLQKRMRGGERVLDAGSGSGILSVTAALLGADSVLGFDTDAVAEHYGRALAEDNGAESVCSFRTGGFECLHAEETGFDAVLANIYSDVIQAHAADLRERLAPDGWFAFSGCPEHHLDATVAAVEAADLVVQEDLCRGRWHTLVGVGVRA